MARPGSVQPDWPIFKKVLVTKFIAKAKYFFKIWAILKKVIFK